MTVPFLLAAGFLATCLTALAVVDARSFRLPDALTGALAAGGIISSFVLGDPTLIDALAGALLAGGVLGLVRHFYRVLRHIDGLGLGDVKLAAAGGVWLGWTGVGLMILLAACGAATFAIARAGAGRPLGRSDVLPFGPFLALAILLVWGIGQWPS
jgi:leader peptidase (prepilin peptidase)/N-methyltransferase